MRNNNVIDFVSAKFTLEWAAFGITRDEKPDYQTDTFRYVLWDAMNDGFWPHDYLAEYALSEYRY